MSSEGTVMVNRQLVDAWNRTLPNTLDGSDRADVHGDESDSSALRIKIHTAGHTGYSFDFVCRYVDKREVEVEMVDVDKDGRSVDEHTDVIQSLTEDYTRHIHECAQVLHQLTHPEGGDGTKCLKR